MTPFIFVLLALSVWRVTHLVVEDTIPIIAKPREWVVARKPDGNLAYLLNCTYCSSVWIAAIHVLLVNFALDYEMAVPVAVVGALSILAAFGETLIDWLDRFGT